MLVRVRGLDLVLFLISWLDVLRVGILIMRRLGVVIEVFAWLWVFVCGWWVMLVEW